jgi:hypothetical protein
VLETTGGWHSDCFMKLKMKSVVHNSLENHQVLTDAIVVGKSKECQSKPTNFRRTLKEIIHPICETHQNSRTNPLIIQQTRFPIFSPSQISPISHPPIARLMRIQTNGQKLIEKIKALDETVFIINRLLMPE